MGDLFRMVDRSFLFLFCCKRKKKLTLWLTNHRVRTLCNNDNYPRSHRMSQRNHVTPSRFLHGVSLLLAFSRCDPQVRPPGGCDEHNLYWGGGSLAEKSNTQPQSSAACFGAHSQSLQTLGISRATTDQAQKGKSERSRVCRGGGSSWKAGDTEKPPIIR